VISANPANKTILTFILPVLNRQEVIIRGIESCLACTSDKITPHVLLVEGGSTDQTVERITQTYKNDSRVELIRQPLDLKGFQKAAWFAVDHVKSELATFMYSDDLVSPHFIRMAEALAASPDVSISLGYGQQAGEFELIQFPPIERVERTQATRILDAYYGRVAQLDGRSMPVSPVCCAVRTTFLREWQKESQRFANETPLRQHAMIKLAGGPDLMIYLYALLRGGREALRANQTVGQLTVTADSITTTGNQEVQLTVGYWLGRVWGFQEALRTGQKELAAHFGGYLIATWYYIMLKKLQAGEKNWKPELRAELDGIKKSLKENGLLLKAWAACASDLLARARMSLGGKRRG
jgi:hypothetical protein